jgi:hypothetical protein
MVWLTEEGDNVGNNMGQSAGTRQWEGAQQAVVSPSTALLPQEGKGLMALPLHLPPFMTIVSPGRLVLGISTVKQLQRTDQWVLQEQNRGGE